MRALLFLLLVGWASAHTWDVNTPLDDYLNRSSPEFSWSEYDSYSEFGFTMYMINFTSHRWMDETFVQETVWWHYLSIAIPDVVRFNDAMMLYIGAGNNDDPEPIEMQDEILARIGNMAVSSGSVVAYLKMNPNQPIHFVLDPLPRVEDFIIGYTFGLYIEEEGTPNPDVVLHLPMVKCAKLAVDATIQIAAQKNPSIQITRYMPTGYSKRGWVTYLLAATDRRVFCATPIVFSLLNMLENLHHHRRSLGGWSWAFSPYWIEGVTRHLDHPRAFSLQSFIDPLQYNPRLTMPKLLIQASADEFFLPDDSHYFYDNLNGKNYFLMIDNTNHWTDGRLDDVERNMEAFYVAQLTNFVYPDLVWMRNETEHTGTIVLQTNTPPINIRAFMAESNSTIQRRDYRYETLDGLSNIWWDEYSVEDMGNDAYFIEFNKPTEVVWRAFFISASFPGPEGRVIDLTSEVNIIPDVMPFPRCTTPDECEGEIV